MCGNKKLVENSFGIQNVALGTANVGKPVLFLRSQTENM